MLTDSCTSRRYLGIDVGTKRYGLALSDAGSAVASPHDTLEVSTREEAVEAIVELIRDRSIDVVVVGWPVRMDGTEGRAVEHVQSFIEALSEALDEESPEIARWDERLSSSAAESVLLEADVSRRKRREVIDKVASTRILQNYLDAEGNRSEHDET